ncbi:hypothetical protein BWQ96_01974 [Gracilariopsis chorda]|uniref:Uncharacterized protein n=1 Tax=Gracilariopsis chorda TaxID=448386 RepID=A0A2V3J1S1_9FLOR|nr:hypothetical protein BWQ96_01974 [Gracilariopsis chorda]|eukprot:PXF48285.1 hypothetical protein BWQ96_01974 [Gracilariopsis chorda]
MACESHIKTVGGSDRNLGQSAKQSLIRDAGYVTTGSHSVPELFSYKNGRKDRNSAAPVSGASDGHWQLTQKQPFVIVQLVESHV